MNLSYNRSTERVEINTMKQLWEFIRKFKQIWIQISKILFYLISNQLSFVLNRENDWQWIFFDVKNFVFFSPLHLLWIISTSICSMRPKIFQIWNFNVSRCSEVRAIVETNIKGSSSKSKPTNVKICVLQSWAPLIDAHSRKSGEGCSSDFCHNP